jgi:hypothetical protein
VQQLAQAGVDTASLGGADGVRDAATLAYVVCATPLGCALWPVSAAQPHNAHSAYRAQVQQRIDAQHALLRTRFASLAQQEHDHAEQLRKLDQARQYGPAAPRAAQSRSRRVLMRPAMWLWRWWCGHVGTCSKSYSRRSRRWPPIRWRSRYFDIVVPRALAQTKAGRPGRRSK